MIKNQANQKFTVTAFNASGRVSGIAGSITCTLKIDTGSRVGTNDIQPTEIGTTGKYEFDLLQAETNGHELNFNPVSSTSGVEVVGSSGDVIYTQAAAGSGDALEATSQQILTKVNDGIIRIPSDQFNIGYIEIHRAADYKTGAHPTKKWLVDNGLIDLTSYVTTPTCVITDKKTQTAVVTFSTIAITDPNGANQQVALQILASETTALSKGKKYDFKFTLQNSGGDKFVVDEGTFNVLS